MYKTLEGHRKLVAWYDAQLTELPGKSRTISTPSGDTHIIEAGSAAYPPLILLPGTNFSALSWQHYIAPLSAHFHVIAADVIGQPGKSAPVRPSFKGTEYERWLLALLDVLNIDRAYLMGHSLGGWLALKLAAHAPQRVAKIILIDPAGIIPLSITPCIILKSLPFVLMPGESSARGMLEMMSLHPLNSQTIKWMTLVGQHIKSSLAPPPLSASELQSIKADILLLSGKQDVFLPPDKLVQASCKALSNLRTLIVPDTGHLLPEEQPQLVLAQVLGFLQSVGETENSEKSLTG